MAKKNKLLLQNQSGAALVIALIILVLLTLISLSSSITSISEIKLSGNKRGNTDAFYTADGGIQATIANPDNFKATTYTLIAGTGGISPDIISQSVNTYLPDNKTTSNPKVTFAPGVQWSTLTSAPTVVIYHETNTGAPRGVGGFSAAGGVGYEYYIVDSTGTESLGSRSEVVTTVVRIIPSAQGGN